MATRTWVGDTSTAFATAANWSDNTLPVNGDTIVFDSSADANCILIDAQPSASAAHKFAEVIIENNFDQTLILGHANTNLKTDKLTIKAKGKITTAPVNAATKISFFGGGTSGVFVFFNHADMASSPTGMFDTATSRSNVTFDFGSTNNATAVKLENGVYPNLTFVGNTNSNTTFSPTAVTAAGTNTYPTSDILNFTTDSDTSVIPATKNQADLNKTFRIHGNIYAQCADFNWGNSILEIQPQDTSGSKVPYNGNYTSSGNFRYGTAAKVFKAKYNHLRIAGLSGKYFEMDAGAILSCNKLTILPDARFYGPDTTVNKGAEIQTIEQPTVLGDWNFSQLSDGIYRSRSNPPPNQEYHNILTNNLGTANQVLAMNSGGTALEWSSTAGGGGLDAVDVNDTDSGFTWGTNNVTDIATLKLVAGANVAFASDTSAKAIRITSTDTNTTYSVMASGNSYAAGLVAAGSGTHNNTFLRKDGTWAAPPDSDTTYSVMASGNSYAAGLVAAGSGTHGGNFLRKDGTWAVPPDTDTVYTHPNHSGDVTSSGDGATTIANDAVTYAKMQDVSATSRVLGRITSGSGVVEELTGANIRTIANVEDGATADQTNAEIRAAVEAATDSNVFTDADHSKLNAIEASATADQTASEITALLNDVASYTLGTSSGTITIGDDLTVTGDLVVNGDTTTVNTATLTVEDPLIKLASANPANSLDLGLYGKWVDSGTTKYAGLIRDATDSKWKFFDRTSSNNEPDTAVNIATYATVKAATFEGNLTGDVTGNVTGNVSGTSGSTTGNAATATALATARAINGVDFDGTAAITVPAAGSTLTDTVTVAKGGTGATTLASNAVLTGNGTSAVQAESNLTYDGNTLSVKSNSSSTALTSDPILLVRPVLESSRDAALKIQGARNGNTSANTAALILSNQDDHLSNANEFNHLGAIVGRVSDMTDNHGDMHFLTFSDGATANDTMTLKGDGKVGIGTTSPSATFSVANTLTYDTGVLTMDVGSSSQDDVAQVILDGYVTNSTNTISEIVVKNAGNSIGNIVWGRESANDAGFVTFGTQPTGGNIIERMRITSTGDVEIKHATEADKTTITSNSIQLFNDNGSGSSATVKMWAETWGGKVGTTSGDDFFIHSAGSDRLKFDGSMRTTFLGNSAADPIIRLTTKDTSVSDTDDLGVIEWVADYDSDDGDTDLVAASISAVAEADFTATANTTALVFKTGTSEAATEKMRLTNTGSIELSNGTPATPAADHVRMTEDGGYLKVNTPSGYISIGPGSSSWGHILTDRGKFYMNKPLVLSGGSTGGDAYNLSSYNDQDLVLATQSGSEDRITIKSDDGHVGIGTTSPDDLLHLKGTDAALLVEDAGSNSNPAVEIKNDAVHWKLQARGDDSDKFRIGEGSSTHVVVDTSGNVGLGTTSPSTPLHVRTTTTSLDNVLLLENNGGSGSPGVGIKMFSNVGTTNYLEILHDAFGETNFKTVNGGDTYNKQLFFHNNGKVSFETGNVGIGVHDAAFPLEVEGWISSASGLVHKGDTNNTIEFDTDKQKFNTAGSTRMLINSDGNIGLNTNSPENLLNVNGTIQAGMQSGLYTTLAANALTFHRTSASYIDQDGDGGSINFRVETESGGSTDYHTELTIKEDNVIIPNKLGVGSTANALSPSAFSVTSSGHDLIHLNRTVSNEGWGVGIIGRLGHENSTTAAHEYAAIFFQIEDNTENQEKGSIAFNTSSGGTPADSGSTHAMQITSAGKVGIGLTDPATQLDVKGDISAKDTGAGGGVGLHLQNSEGQFFLYTDAGNLIVKDYAGSDTYPFKVIGAAANDTLLVNTSKNVDIVDTLRIGSTTSSSLYQIECNGLETGNNYSGFKKTVSSGSGSGSEINLMQSWGGAYQWQHNSSAGAKVFAKFAASSETGRVELYHNNVKRLETVATGVTITGLLSATTKSFDIEHPTKPKMRLRYGSLEGPEHGVYIRGKNNSGTIHLPDYWKGLVDEDSITVQLTAIGNPQELYVRSVSNGKVRVAAKSRGKHLEYFYFIQAERKDVDKLVVEYDAE